MEVAAQTGSVRDCSLILTLEGRKKEGQVNTDKWMSNLHHLEVCLAN